MKFTNWLNYFKSRGDNDQGNKNQTVYSHAWNQTTPHATKLTTLTGDPSNIILAADTEGTIFPIHSFTNLGGTLLRPANKIAGIIGSGNMGVAVIVDENTVTMDCYMVTPPAAVIIAATSVTELKNIPTPDLVDADEDSFFDYKGCTTFLPAPWLVESILTRNSNDPFELILAAKTSATAFDDEHGLDPDYPISAFDHLSEFVVWAWGVKQNLVNKLSYRIDVMDAALHAYHSEREDKCIIRNPTLTANPAAMPPPGPPPTFTPTATHTTNEAILHQLAASISCQTEEAATHNELLTRQLEHNLEKEDKKKDRFKKLHSSTKQLILFASAADVDDVPQEVGEACKRFFNAETTGVAEQELNLQFKNLGLQDAAFSPGLTQALYAGKFLWADKSTPSNFSPFSIFEVEPLRAADQQNRHLILHLVETQGKGKTLDEIKASSKQEVKAPTTYLEMYHQLTFFAGACSIFFGATSIPAQAISALVALAEKNRHTLKARESNKTFMSQFLFAVDTRFQLWLDECMTLTHRPLVDDSMLNFNSIVEAVRFGTFHVSLPVTFVSPSEKKEDPMTNKPTGKQPEKQADEDETHSKKRQRTNNRKGKPVQNESQPDSCKLLPTETWQTHFANKGFTDRVDWDGSCKMCPRWFIRGYCYKDCINQASHVNSEDLPAEKLAAFQQFMRTCRGN